MEALTTETIICEATARIEREERRGQWVVILHSIKKEERNPDDDDIPSFLALFVALYQELTEDKGI